MPSILDTFPYPWHDRRAQDLHVHLMNMCPTVAGALFFAEKAGLSRGEIFAEQAPAFVWKEILDKGAAGGFNAKIVQNVREAYPKSAKRPFLDALLAGEQDIATDAEPRGEVGAPNFARDNDEVTELEALLYQDDLTISTGLVPALIETLHVLVDLAPGVARVSAEVSGGTMLGTAFRIGPELLLTNHHVVHDKNGEDARNIRVEFGHEEDAAGNGQSTRLFNCRKVAADPASDWAVIRAEGALDAAWPIIALSKGVAPVKGEPAFIIQHPGGNRKRIGFVRNQIVKVDDAFVHYLTDTQTGSSGSPVFNARGQLIALHHAGGRPQEVAGKPPVRKNEGVRLEGILKGLKEDAKIDVP